MLLGVASRVACSRRSNSRTQCLGEVVRGGNEGRLGRERGNSPSLVSSVIFFSSLINFSTALYYLNTWNRLLPARSDHVASYFRSCFHYRSGILLFLVYVAGGFVWEGQRKGVRGEWSALSHTLRACYRGFTSLFTLAEQ